MDKPWNNKAWFMVLPVLLLVAFSAVIPLMTVVNYSVQDTFGNNEFFWAGTAWYEEVLASDRFWDSMGRNLVFSAIILAIQIPLGIFIALNMPRSGWGVSVCLVLMALKRRLRSRASRKRWDFRVSSNHSVPAQKNWLFPKVSWTE